MENGKETATNDQNYMIYRSLYKTTELCSFKKISTSLDDQPIHNIPYNIPHYSHQNTLPFIYMR